MKSARHVFLVLLTAALGFAPASAKPGFTRLPTTGRDNWAMLTVTAGSRAIDLDLQMDVSGWRTKGPVLVGTGFGETGGGWGMNWRHLGGGQTHITTTRTIGSINVDTGQKASDWEAAGITIWGGFKQIPARRTVVVVAALTGYKFYEVSIPRPKASGPFRYSITRGDGAFALTAADATDDGAAAGVGHAAAGTFTHTFRSPVPLAGGFVYSFCSVCSYSWKTPNGRTGSGMTGGRIASGASYVEGDKGMSGPAGTWSLTWNGAGVADIGESPLYAAFVPVGNAWKLF